MIVSKKCCIQGRGRFFWSLYNSYIVIFTWILNTVLTSSSRMKEAISMSNFSTLAWTWRRLHAYNVPKCKRTSFIKYLPKKTLKDSLSRKYLVLLGSLGEQGQDSFRVKLMSVEGVQYPRQDRSWGFVPYREAWIRKYFRKKNSISSNYFFQLNSDLLRN